MKKTTDEWCDLLKKNITMNDLTHLTREAKICCIYFLITEAAFINHPLEKIGASTQRDIVARD